MTSLVGLAVVSLLFLALHPDATILSKLHLRDRAAAVAAARDAGL